MKNIFTKKNLMPLIVLSSICLIVAALMGGINMLTAPKIAFNEEQKVYDSLRQVLDGTFEALEIPSSAPSTVTGLFKVSDENGEFKGNVVTVEQKGYAGKILLTIGFDKDGKTTKVVITAQSESHGKDINPLLDRLSGISSDAVSDVDVVTGATISSGYIKSAVSDAFKAIGQNGGENDGGEEDAEELPKTEEEIQNIAKAMVSDEISLTKCELDSAPSVLKRIYDAGDDGYFLYVVVPGAYVPVATEAVIHVANDGKIVKTNLLSWIVGHGVGAGDFADGFNGKDKETAGSVELVSGATGTASDFRDAVEDSLVYLADNFGSEETLPKTDEEIKNIAKEMVDSDITLSDVEIDNSPAALKRAYDAGDNGYFLYVVVPGAYVPVATEAVVHVDNSGKIVKVNLLSWIVGHDVVAGDFADKFAGKDKENVGKVELVSGATGTASDFRDAVTAALSYIVEKFDLKESLPTSEDEIKAIANEMAGKELTLSDFEVSSAPKTLKKVYSAGADGYFLYIVVPGKYVPVATEAVVYLNESCEIVKVNLLSWIVGHGVEPGDFADGFIGKDKNNIGGVDLVTGATGTASDFRTALETAVITVADGDSAKETLLVKRMNSLVPNASGFEKLEISENAASTLKAFYKVLGFDGYVAYVITSTKYVDVETEALVYINSKGEIGNIDLMTWTVGHGIEPGDFAQSLIGKSADELKDVELVTAATVTAGNLRDAVVDAINVIPMNYTPTIIGAVVMALSAVAAVAVIIIKRRKNG